MNIHIGNEIAQMQKKRGIQNEDFAKRINTSVRNLTNIKIKDDLSVKQLFKISEVLDFNFFSLFEPIVVAPTELRESKPQYHKDKRKHTIKLEVQYPAELAGELGKFMMHVDGIAQKVGFELL